MSCRFVLTVPVAFRMGSGEELWLWLLRLVMGSIWATKVCIWAISRIKVLGMCASYVNYLVSSCVCQVTVGGGGDLQGNVTVTTILNKLFFIFPLQSVAELIKEPLKIPPNFLLWIPRIYDMEGWDCGMNEAHENVAFNHRMFHQLRIKQYLPPEQKLDVWLSRPHHMELHAHNVNTLR